MNSTQTDLPKTLLIGLDAACWEFLDPLLQAGELPTIRRLMDTGVHGILRSTLPASTPVAWSSIVTGKNPGKHGVFDMLWRKPGTYQFHPTSLAVRQGTPFWTRLNEKGIRVGLINVPFSYPPPTLDGFSLAGFGAPDTTSELTYPPDLMAWITEHVGAYVAPSKLYELRKQKSIDQIVALEHEHQAMLVRIANALHAHDPVHVLVINLMLLDHINHLNQDRAVVADAIRQLDRDLDAIIQSFQPDHIMAISDHGSRAIEGVFYVHNWLVSNGYAARMRRSRQESKGALNELLRQWLQDAKGWSGPGEKIVRRVLLEWLARFPDTGSRSIWTAIHRVFPNAREFVNFTGKPDFAASSTFRASTYSGNLYANVRDRDPKGVVPPEARHTFLNELREKLLALRDPDGAPLIAGAFLREELYHGPGVDYSPDLVLDTYSSRWNASLHYPGLQRGGDYLYKRSTHEGWHSRDGIFIYSGPAFRSGRSDTLRYMMDIPATLLALYDVPIPEDFDGQVMAETLNPAWAAQHPVGSQPGDPEEASRFDVAGGEEDNELLLAQLRALGYID